ncbi:hypothetical protein N7470_005745 [Penicillium chermesinum]|nr:hypothetical protein N7470_005745 [Penicillium chermesinum]
MPPKKRRTTSGSSSSRQKGKKRASGYRRGSPLPDGPRRSARLSEKAVTATRTVADDPETSQTSDVHPASNDEGPPREAWSPPDPHELNKLKTTLPTLEEVSPQRSDVLPPAVHLLAKRARREPLAIAEALLCLTALVDRRGSQRRQ